MAYIISNCLTLYIQILPIEIHVYKFTGNLVLFNKKQAGSLTVICLWLIQIKFSKNTRITDLPQSTQIFCSANLIQTSSSSMFQPLQLCSVMWFVLLSLLVFEYKLLKVLEFVYFFYFFFFVFQYINRQFYLYTFKF